MTEPKRMVVLPYDLGEETQDVPQLNTVNTNSTKLPEEKISKKLNLDRQSRIIKIALLLANNKAFDDNFFIKQEDGTFNPSSNISKLLILTQKKVKDTNGLSDLIRELFNAKIEPDLILNEFIKQRLLELYNNNNTRNFSSIKRKRKSNSIDIVQPIKRKSLDTMEMANDKLWQIPFENEDDPDL